MTRPRGVAQGKKAQGSSAKTWQEKTRRRSSIPSVGAAEDHDRSGSFEVLERSGPGGGRRACGRTLAVTPHGLLGRQDERGEAGQRLSQLQERVLQERQARHTGA